MAKKKAPTIYDVAKEAGVSTATVSRVLNEPGKVNSETRKSILQVIENIGYIPQAEASARARKQFGRIGVLSPFFTAPAFVQRLRGISAVLAQSKYELVVYAVNSMAQLEEYLHMLPVSYRLDGLIIMSLRIDEDTVRRLNKNNLETVMIEAVAEEFSAVNVDNYRGGYIVGEHAVSRGFKRCAFLGEEMGPPYSIYPTRERFKGFSEALSEGGSKIDEPDTLKSQVSVDSARTAIKEYFGAGNLPDMVFAASDLQAIGVLKAALDLGISVPDKVAVVGFDDIDAADYMDITTVSQHLDDTGRLAADLLLRRLDDPDRPVEQITIPLKLIPRRTS